MNYEVTLYCHYTCDGYHKIAVVTPMLLVTFILISHTTAVLMR